MNKQQIIDEVLEACRKQLEDVYDYNENDIETTGTQVKLINNDLETVVYNLEYFATGTLLNCGGWEAFLIANDKSERRWVTFSGEQYSDERLADLMRHNGAKVMVIHWGI